MLRIKLFFTNLFRFGWFILQDTVANGKEDSVYWKIFRNQTAAAEFSLNVSDVGVNVTDYFYHRYAHKFFCTSSFCENGVYVPNRCKPVGKDSPSCALLLAGDYG